LALAAQALAEYGSAEPLPTRGLALAAQALAEYGSAEPEYDGALSLPTRSA
jgi:hypothetical protein